MFGPLMSLDARPMRLTLHAIGLLAISSLVLSVTATPIPLPLPLMAADYSLSLVSANRSTPFIASRRLQTLPTVPSIYSTKRSRQLGSLGSVGSFGSLADLAQYSDAASQNANTLNDLAANSANVDNDDYDFQQKYVSGLSEFNTNAQGFQEALAKASSDKGLANFDKQNDLEKFLKEFINAHKKVLNATATVVSNLPVLGPILGPIVYQLKCILDGILNALEDFGDALINDLGPILQALLGKTTAILCNYGVDLLGLCV